MGNSVEGDPLGRVRQHPTVQAGMRSNGTAREINTAPKRGISSLGSDIFIHKCDHW